MGLPRSLVGIREADRVSVDLVAFPCAGGGPGMFAGWKDRLPAGWRLRAVCLPGRDVRFNEDYATSMDALADEIADALGNVPAQGQRVYLGHSMGSFLAYEVASRLLPDVLVTTAASPPHVERDCFVSTESDEQAMAELRRLVADASGVDVTDDPHVLTELIELAAEALTADLAMLDKSARSTDPVSCDIHSYYGVEDDLPCQPWDRETTGKSTATLVAGDHFFVRSPPRDFLTDLVLRLEPGA